MEIYNAIMAAADRIERDPGHFKFTTPSIPKHCGSPGCALGWIGFYLGERDGCVLRKVAETHLGYTENPTMHIGHPFYERMARLAGYAWIQDAALCARGLRLYAAIYHAPAKPQFTGLPDSVREIFTVKEGA